MDYRTIVGNSETLTKLAKTNALPWKIALLVADYLSEVEGDTQRYQKAMNAIQFKYGILKSDESKHVPQLQAREEDIEELLDTKIEMEFGLTLTEEDVQKLYVLKDKDDEPTFNINDIKAFKQLGILNS